MELKHRIETPPTDDKIVEDYLKTIMLDKKYPVFTLNDKLEIIECEGLICNNGSWNHHNNYDDSENELYVYIKNEKINKWFSLNRKDVVIVQQENILKWKKILENELERLKNLK